jgi:hypothetical protein
VFVSCNTTPSPKKVCIFLPHVIFCIVLLLVGIVDRLVPQEVQAVLIAEEDNKVDLADREEHGTLDFFGRDFIRKASRKIGEWKNAFKVRFSRDTQGLDCNKTLSEGKVDKFKSRVKAIYPGRVSSLF